MFTTAGPGPVENEEAAELVARIRRGDRAAEAKFAARYERGLLILLKRVTGNVDLALDLRQDVLRIALERLRTRGIDEPERLAGWLAGTARKLALGEVRKQVRRQTYIGLPEDGEHVAGDADEQLQVIERDEQVALVRQLIAEMSNPRDRELLFRYYVGDEEKAALCERFELTPEHLHRVLFRARQRFKTLYEARVGTRAAEA